MSNTQTRFRASILALTGGAALYGSRVYAKYAPEGTLEGAVWVVMDTISTRREAAHDGDGFTSQVQFQLTIGGGKRDEIETVKDFLIAGLNGHTYTDATGTVSSLLENATDSFDFESRLYTASLDFTVLDDNT